MAKKKAISAFKGLALARVLADSILAYQTEAAFAIPYAGSMSRTAKERTGELYYDDELYAQINETLGEEVEIRVAEVSLELLEDLGLGVYDPATNRLEADFAVAPGTYSLRCVTDTLDNVPFFFNWRVFDLTSIRFDNFATKNNSVTVCEVIIKGVCKKPKLPTVKPWAIMQLKDDASNQSACEAFMANAESFPTSAAPVITITEQPKHTAVVEGAITEQLTVAATATMGAALSYQWYSNDSLSNAGGTLVSGAESASFGIPTSLAAGTYYYYCVVSAPGAVSVASVPAIAIVMDGGE
jgi:hypothetical protein